MNDFLEKYPLFCFLVSGFVWYCLSRVMTHFDKKYMRK